MSDIPSKKICLTPAERAKRSRLKKKLNQPPRYTFNMINSIINLVYILYTFVNCLTINFSEYKYTYDTCYVPANPSDPPSQFLNDLYQQPTTSTAPFVLHQVPPQAPPNPVPEF